MDGIEYVLVLVLAGVAISATVAIILGGVCAWAITRMEGRK